MNSLNMMRKKLQSKGLDTRIFSVEGQGANHYPMEQSSLNLL